MFRIAADKIYVFFREPACTGTRSCYSFVAVNTVKKENKVKISIHLTPASLQGRLTRFRQARRTNRSTSAPAKSRMISVVSPTVLLGWEELPKRRNSHGSLVQRGGESSGAHGEEYIYSACVLNIWVPRVIEYCQDALPFFDAQGNPESLATLSVCTY